MPALTSLGSPEQTAQMSADVDFSPSSALWVLIAIVVLGSLAAWLWVVRSRNSRGPSARPAVFSLFADVTEIALPSAWSDEQIIAVIGDVRMDLRGRAPAPGAILRIFHLIGDVDLRVPSGTRVVSSGSTVLGKQRVDIEPGEGPALEVRGWGLVGDLLIRD